MAPLAGRVALVTGASRGIGRAYALALADAGAAVVVTARTVGPTEAADPPVGSLAEVLAAIRAVGGTGWALAGDLTDVASIERMVADALATAGRIDVLVNNAGVFPHHDSLAITPEEWDHSFAVNVRGPYFAARAVLPQMIERGSGSIVNITSLTARPTVLGSAGHTDLLTYAVSKAALERLTTFLAEDLRPFGIAVNALSPGGVLTESWRTAAPADYEAARRAGTARPSTPEALGPPLVHLAGETAAGITGRILHTNDFGRTWPGDVPTRDDGAGARHAPGES
jgi:NAD(P)-dependent dehydrogenase (short-subunit alcohol dehydrogenase family)